jgi:hypothetical protein
MHGNSARKALARAEVLVDRWVAVVPLHQPVRLLQRWLLRVRQSLRLLLIPYKQHCLIYNFAKTRLASRQAGFCFIERELYYLSF